MSKPLKGVKIVSFESRKAEAIEQLITKQGGTCIQAPSMQEIPLENNHDVYHFADKLFNNEIDVVIFLTGVGTRTMIEMLEKKHSLEKITHALSVPITVTRGPKPTKVLNEYKIPISLKVGEPNTWRQVIQELDDHKEIGSLKDKVIAVQEYGIMNQSLIEGLKLRGANVIRVPIYRWALPDDLTPLKKGIDTILDGHAQFALFTNGAQIHHIMRVATEEGKDQDLKQAMNRISIASIGPICTQQLSSFGIGVDIEPDHSTMGAFVLEIVKKASSGNGKQSTLSIPPTFRPQDDQELQNSPFMKALRREETDVTPVWLMRQAGRYMKEYRDIRKKVPFLDFCKNKDLVTEITVKAQELLDADAAIIFSDILVLVECFGLDLEFSQGDGPAIKVTLDEGKRIDEIEVTNVEDALKFVFDAIAQTRRALKPNIPLLGFAGAPFTLASYMIEGGTSKTFQRTKSFMYSDPGRWSTLMSKICDGLIIYLKGQINAGVQAIQLFDSWVGCLGPSDYQEFVKPFTSKVIEGLGGKVPIIHFGTSTTSLLGHMAEAGGDVIGVDYRVRLDDAWSIIGYEKGIQGNLDPLVLYSDKNFIKKRVKSILDQAQRRPGHVFNLGHGILPETPVENAKYLIETVHELSSV